MSHNECDERSPEVVIGSRSPASYIVGVMKAVRCLLATLLLLVFGGGTVFAAEQNGMIIPSSVAVSADTSAPDTCNDCGGDKSTIAAACSAFGSCIQAVDVVAASAFPLPACTVYPAVGEHVAGFKRSPEPFPPKARILA